MSIAAALLIAARTGALLTELPEAVRPTDPAAAVALQREIAAALGPVGGWKVGAAGPDAPISCAPMPASGILVSPAVLPVGRSASGVAVEAEVAFRLGTDLPPRAIPYARAEIVAALATAHPAIEWLECRFADPGAVDPLSLLADSSMHGGFVFGPGLAAWPALDFATLEVAQDVGGLTARGRGNPAGDMIRLIQYLADGGAAWDGGLRAGQFVTCGSWTGKTPLVAGQAARATFAGLGEASLTA